MRVILAKSAGFCWGVKRAVDRARDLARVNEGPIYTDGPLIHNQQMMQQLESEGIVETAEPGSVPGEILLVRAHGIPPDRRAMLEKLPVKLVDVTCPDVAKIQKTIKKYAGEGYYIIIFGDTGHAEVTGLLGYADGKGFVVDRPEDVDGLPDVRPVCLVSQSTQFPFYYEKTAKAVLRRFPDAEVLDTICKSTKNRQGELLEIAGNVDAMVVVGGLHSANTVRLVKLAQTLKPTFHIQTSDQLKAEQFRNFKTVGLSAGASTPAFIIKDVKKKLENMQA